ncbi:Uncharacterized conserved protein, DUF305 family [Micromonospora phaseoli]|uniref:Uncharacterized conserved protein, DUF305 family n=1 Tax=Micromonospora phaseoli TaxID=1144548 RepID=A0A1H6ZX56_9ACTN|nr:DUF305 domain-containing protein [Micromonospora phaseoli]PZV97174.1 uncharacterized protein (DUF305 family) [Micromonospora phaseoli]GIJ77246.1 hypothetical protein Xph01_16780 [Micromonospora phaseoli]SEJ53385.1 Uncharacterized conserved protein, DUF305 family [Micromonospora phaseoli]
MNRTYLRRTLQLGVSLAVAVGLAACGSDHGAAHDAPGTSSASAFSGESAASNATDVMFAQMMIPHHQQAVEMSDLAATRASDPQVEQLAVQIKDAQAPEITQLRHWLTQWGAPMPGADGDGHGTIHSTPEMDHEMPGMMSDADMAKLAAASGTEFDRQFLTMMIAHHEGAITMGEEEAAEGANPEARALAQRIITTQRAEIDTMKKILDRL